jgi:peptide/nickel transport system substrate-binding protein
MKSQRRSALLIAAALCLVVAACAGPKTPEGPAQVRSLSIAIDNDEGLLTPMNWNTWVGYYLTAYVYDTLLNRDLTNSPIPGIAESYAVSSDGLVWKLNLRQDVMWHDGQKLTAEDVVFSFEANKKRRPGQFAIVDTVTAEGDNAVTITLTQVSPFFASEVLMSMFVIPEHIWKDVEILEERTPFEAKVGSGPFKLLEAKPNEYYHLEANDQYWGGKPLVDEIVAQIIKDRPAQFQALKAGEVDAVVVSIPAALVGELDQSEGIALKQGADFFNYVLMLNLDRPPFDQQQVRQAVELAINKQQLVDLVLQGRGTVLPPSYYHPELPHARRDIQAEFNPGKARQLLDSVGLKDGDGDGVREMNGKPLQFTLLCDSNNPAEVRTGELLKAMLADVGIAITQNCMDVDTQCSFVWPKFHAKNVPDYEMSTFAWSAGPQTSRPFLRGMVHSDIENVGWANTTGYRNPEMDKLVDELIVTADPARQDELQSEIGALFAAELPFIPLFCPDGNFAYRPEAYDQWTYLQGVGILPRMSFLPGFER